MNSILGFCVMFFVVGFEMQNPDRSGSHNEGRRGEAFLNSSGTSPHTGSQGLIQNVRFPTSPSGYQLETPLFVDPEDTRDASSAELFGETSSNLYNEAKYDPGDITIKISPPSSLDDAGSPEFKEITIEKHEIGLGDDFERTVRNSAELFGDALSSLDDEAEYDPGDTTIKKSPLFISDVSPHSEFEELTIEKHEIPPLSPNLDISGYPNPFSPTTFLPALSPAPSPAAILPGPSHALSPVLSPATLLPSPVPGPSTRYGSGFSPPPAFSPVPGPSTRYGSGFSPPPAFSPILGPSNRHEEFLPVPDYSWTPNVKPYNVYVHDPLNVQQGTSSSGYPISTPDLISNLPEYGESEVLTVFPGQKQAVFIVRGKREKSTTREFEITGRRHKHKEEKYGVTAVKAGSVPRKFVPILFSLGDVDPSKVEATGYTIASVYLGKNGLFFRSTQGDLLLENKHTVPQRRLPQITAHHPTRVSISREKSHNVDNPFRLELGELLRAGGTVVTTAYSTDEPGMYELPMHSESMVKKVFFPIGSTIRKGQVRVYNNGVEEAILNMRITVGDFPSLSIRTPSGTLSVHSTDKDSLINPIVV